MSQETWADETQRLTFRKLYTVLGRFREIDGDMGVQQMVVLAWVALNEGRTQRDMRQALDMPSSTASRNLAALSKVHRLGKEGHDLVYFFEDPNDRRAKTLWLTTKGRRFVQKLLGDL